jgi:hypothetical protein
VESDGRQNRSRVARAHAPRRTFSLPPATLQARTAYWYRQPGVTCGGPAAVRLQPGLRRGGGEGGRLCSAARHLVNELEDLLVALDLELADIRGARVAARLVLQQHTARQQVEHARGCRPQRVRQNVGKDAKGGAWTTV